jgi:hypothetical protein
VPQRIKVAKVTWEQCKEIATAKLPDLNTDDPEQGAHIIAGTARSMGYIVEGHPAGRDDAFEVCSEAEFERMKKSVKTVPEAAPGAAPPPTEGPAPEAGVE